MTLNDLSCVVGAGLAVFLAWRVAPRLRRRAGALTADARELADVGREKPQVLLRHPRALKQVPVATFLIEVLTGEWLARLRDPCDKEKPSRK